MTTSIALYLLCAIVLFAMSGLAFTFPSGGGVLGPKTLNSDVIASVILKRNTASNQKLFISRDEEEEFFQPEMDRKSFKEKLPIAVGVFVGKKKKKKKARDSFISSHPLAKFHYMTLTRS